MMFPRKNFSAQLYLDPTSGWTGVREEIAGQAPTPLTWMLLQLLRVVRSFAAKSCVWRAFFKFLFLAIFSVAFDWVYLVLVASDNLQACFFLHERQG